MSDLFVNPTDERLAAAFVPPAHIRDNPALAALHAEIVASMRQEAEGLALETNQLLLLSKIAGDYVEMKHRDETGWVGTNARKDTTAQWLASMAEWRQVLKDNKDKISEKVLENLTKIILDAAGKIENDENRRDVIREIKEKFAQLGY